jgi:phosphotransferase system enzyme I (PtsI)
VAYLYRPLHLAMLRSFQAIVEAAHANNIPVGMCGEMAGDPLHTLILSGLGFDNLSMSAAQLPSVKRIVRGHATSEGRRLVAKCLELDTPDEIERLVRTDMEARFGEGATGHRMDTPTP